MLQPLAAHGPLCEGCLIPPASAALFARDTSTLTFTFLFPFTCSNGHLMDQHGNLQAQIPHWPLQVIASIWKPGLWALSLTHPSQSFCSLEANDFSNDCLDHTTALPTAFECAEGTFSMVCTSQAGSSGIDNSCVLLSGHAVYRENFQGGGQGRCWADNSGWVTGHQFQKSVFMELMESPVQCLCTRTPQT